MNKRTWYLIAASIIILLLFVWLYSNQKQVALYHIGEKQVGNIQNSIFMNKKIYYFTGSSFAVYDPSSKKTSRISPIYNLPDVKTIRWSEKGVVFEASSYSPVDDLYKILEGQQLSTEINYWWVVDFNSGKLTLITDPLASKVVTDVIWGSQNSKDSLFFTTERKGDDIYNTEIYKLTMGEKANKIHDYSGDKLDNLVWTNGKEFIIETGADQDKDLLKINFVNKQKNVLEEDIRPGTTANPEGSYFTIYKSSTKSSTESEFDIPPGNLFLLDAVKKKSKLIIESFNGHTNWSNEHQGFVSTGITSGSEQYTIFIKPNKKPIFHMAKNKKDISTEFKITHLINLDDLQMWAVDERNNLVELSKKPTPKTDKKEDTALQDDIYEDSFNINYISKSSTYNIYITQNPYSVNQNKALDYINAKGVDPNQIFIKWYAYDKVDRYK